MPHNKVDPELMDAGDRAFWKELDDLDRREERYFVIDTNTGEVVVESARLKRGKTKLKV